MNFNFFKTSVPAGQPKATIAVVAPPAPTVVAKNQVNHQQVSAHKPSQSQTQQGAQAGRRKSKSDQAPAQPVAQISAPIENVSQAGRRKSKNEYAPAQPVPQSVPQLQRLNSNSQPAPSRRSFVVINPEVEKQEILSMLMDAGNDWKPRNRVVKKWSPKPKAKEVSVKSIHVKQATKPITKANSSDMAKAFAPAPLPKGKSHVVYLGDRAPVEKKEILSVLMDAGEDWKPHRSGPVSRRKKGKPVKYGPEPKPVIFGPEPKPVIVKSLSREEVAQRQEILDILKYDAGFDYVPKQRTKKDVKFKPKEKYQQPWSNKIKPGQLARPASAPHPKRGTQAWKAIMLTREQEKNEILGIMMDAGKDWRPRNKVVQNVYKHVPKATKTIKKSKQQPKKRRHTLTDAQKKQKREIMEILLEKEVAEPAPVQRPPTAAQYNADIQIKRGNVVVVNNPVDKNEDLSGFQPVLTRKDVLRQHKAEKQAKEEALLDDMNSTLNVLLDEPNRRLSQQKHYHQIQQNKATSSSKHIHVVQSHSRIKFAY